MVLIGVQLFVNPLLAARLQSESDDSWFQADIHPAQAELDRVGGRDDHADGGHHQHQRAGLAGGWCATRLPELSLDPTGDAARIDLRRRANQVAA